MHVFGLKPTTDPLNLVHLKLLVGYRSYICWIYDELYLVSISLHLLHQMFSVLYCLLPYYCLYRKRKLIAHFYAMIVITSFWFPQKYIFCYLHIICSFISLWRYVAMLVRNRCGPVSSRLMQVHYVLFNYLAVKKQLSYMIWYTLFLIKWKKEIHKVKTKSFHTPPPLFFFFFFKYDRIKNKEKHKVKTEQRNLGNSICNMFKYCYL